MRIIHDMIKDEDGSSLVEVVAAIVLLAILLPSASYLFVFSQKVIKSNQARSEAIQVVEDIKQTFEYRSQTQDWADLNRIALVDFYDEAVIDDNLELRKNHLILDNSGIEYTDHNEPIYGEQPIEEIDDIRGDFMRKVSYDSSRSLPESLASLENQLYMGEYLKWNKLKKEYEVTDYLVRVDVLSSEKRLEEGVDLEIGAWDKKSGHQLYTTVYKWVVKF